MSRWIAQGVTFGSLLASFCLMSTSGEAADPSTRDDSEDARTAAILGGAFAGITYLQAVVIGTGFVAIEAGDSARGEQPADTDDLTAADYTPLYIPAAGPFITIATTGAEDGDARLLVANGIAQVVGVGVLTTGLVMLALSGDDEAVSFVPLVTPHGATIGVVGRF